MKTQLLNYIKAKTKISEPSELEVMKLKFQDPNVLIYLTELLEEGEIYEPRPGTYRWLG